MCFNFENLASLSIDLLLPKSYVITFVFSEPQNKPTQYKYLAMITSIHYLRFLKSTFNENNKKLAAKCE